MAMGTIIFGLIFTFNFLPLYSIRLYENHTLYRAEATTIEHLQFLENMFLQKYLNVKFLKQPHKLYDPVLLMMDPIEKELFVERAHELDFAPELVLENAQELFDGQIIGKYDSKNQEAFNWNAYYTVSDIYKWLADKAHSLNRIAKLESIGKTVLGKDIYVFTVKRVPGKKKCVIVEGGSHGNEWISIAFVTYLINVLLHVESSIDLKFGEIANRYHWHFIPILNPDGYDYNQRLDRMWRKNRRHTVNKFVGVDLNRNFNYSFGNFDASKDPYSDFFAGFKPFSEPETQLLSNYVHKHHSNLKYYFSIHGHGQAFIIPFSDKTAHLENYQSMENVGRQAAYKIYRATGTQFEVGTHYEIIGAKASGDSASWVKDKYKTKYVFTILLGDNGTYGFALPAKEIVPTCREVVIGLTELMTAEPRRIVAEESSSSRKMAPCRSIFFIAFTLSAWKYYYRVAISWMVSLL